MAVITAPDGVRVELNRARAGDRHREPAAPPASASGGRDRLRSAGHMSSRGIVRGGYIACDISDPDAVSAALVQTLASVGVPDRLVAWCRVGASGTLISQDPADWNE